MLMGISNLPQITSMYQRERVLLNQQFCLPGVQGQRRPGLLHPEVRAVGGLGHRPGLHRQAGAVRPNPHADGHGSHRHNLLLIRGHQGGNSTEEVLA